MTKEEILTKYDGKDNYGKDRSEYLNKLFDMTDDELCKECEDKIWLSAYAANNSRSDFHWQCDACYSVCVFKQREGIYSDAWTKAVNKS